MKKQTPQRQRRKELEKNLNEVRQQVLARDSFSCVLCGSRTEQVSHILSRGAHKNLILDIRNLAAICSACHSPYANTEKMVRAQFKAIRKFNYDYSDWLPQDRYFTTEEK